MLTQYATFATAGRVNGTIRRIEQRRASGGETDALARKEKNGPEARHFLGLLRYETPKPGEGCAIWASAFD
jgi:hypothetical protein